MSMIVWSKQQCVDLEKCNGWYAFKNQIIFDQQLSLCQILFTFMTEQEARAAYLEIMHKLQPGMKLYLDNVLELDSPFGPVENSPCEGDCDECDYGTSN